MEKKPKIIAILGATASGKSALGVTLAQAFSGEIISADSRQVYRGLDIGTAKITPSEMAGIPHHLLDITDPADQYDAHQFKTDATRCITDIHTRNHLPIVVGGTFFYVDLLRGRMGTASVAPDPSLRAILEQQTLPALQAQLAELDPATAAVIDTQNPRRLIRAIEIATALGSRPKADTAATTSSYDWLVIGLQVDKETLRARYRARATTWLTTGFREEIAGLLQAGVTPARLREIGFEYTLGLDLLGQRITETEFIDRFEQKNWQYAKRQLTWLKRDPDIQWYTSEETVVIMRDVGEFLHN